MDMEASFPLVHPIESFVSSFALLCFAEKESSLSFKTI